MGRKGTFLCDFWTFSGFVLLSAYIWWSRKVATLQLRKSTSAPWISLCMYQLKSQIGHSAVASFILTLVICPSTYCPLMNRAGPIPYLFNKLGIPTWRKKKRFGRPGGGLLCFVPIGLVSENLQVHRGIVRELIKASGSFSWKEANKPLLFISLNIY